MSYKQRLSKINTFVFDVDGVLTDGNVILDSSGELVRTMHTKDGFAIQHAVKKGFHIVIISGGNSEMVKLRLQGLGINHIFLGAHHKLPILENHLKKVDAVSIVASCKNAIEAFNIISTHNVDLIFLDINMPEISGLSFARSINKNIKINL